MAPRSLYDTLRRHVSTVSVASSIGLSLVVLAIIGATTIESATFVHIRGMRWWMPMVAIAAVALRVLLGGWRLHFIAQGRLQWMQAIRAQLAWDFFSNVTPSTVGGGPIVPAYIVQDSRTNLGEATAIMLFAILMDQVWFSVAIAIVLIGGTYIDIIPASLGAVGNVMFTVYLVAYMAWVTLFGYATVIRPAMLTGLVDRVFSLPLLRRFRKTVNSVVQQMHERASLIRVQPFVFFLKGFLITATIWLSRYALVIILLLGFVGALDVVLAFFRTATMMLGALVVPTPGGAGGIEGLYAVLVGPLIPGPLLTPTLLLWRMLGYYVFIALGAYLTVHQVHKVLGKRASRRSQT